MERPASSIKGKIMNVETREIVPFFVLLHTTICDMK